VTDGTARGLASGRFAIYAAPGVRSSDGAGARLRDTAERWLGRSITGDPVTPSVPAVPDGWTRAAVDAITVSARRYGFHATLKAPFRLAAGRTSAELDAALAAFAASHAAVDVPRLRLARLGGFFALVPGAPAPALYALADEVVTAFDRFRAPPTEAELARRRPAALTPRQRELLKAWGYPYVLDEFQFHLTLTDRIQGPDRDSVERALAGWFAASLDATIGVDALALCTEAEPGAPFLLEALYPLQPPPEGTR